MKTRFLKLSQLKESSTKTQNGKILIVAGVADLQLKKLSSFLPAHTRDRVISALKARQKPLKEGESVMVPPADQSQASIHLAALPKNLSAFSLLGFARDRLKSVLEESSEFFQLVLMTPKIEEQVAECFGAALSVRLFQMPVWGKRAKDKKSWKLKTFELYSSKSQQKNFDYGFETGTGSNLVRELGTTPSNFLNPEIYGRRIEAIAKEHKLSVKFWSKAQLKKMGAGAFVAVDKGDPDSKGGIYELSYSARSAKNKKPVVLVGKGLCFDTGGYDVKTQGYMAQMKGDMQGSAVALSSICTAARLKLPIKMKAYLVITENHISPKAYKADDVIIALNGTSIEVVNTDAEGRMVLADTLTLASRSKPDVMLDYATLTGAAVYSIGSAYSCGFSNREEMNEKIIAAGKKSGERVWPFPMDEDYEKALESSVADTLQCSRSRGGDHILGALFLKKFLEGDFPWIHIDLSAAEKKGGLAHVDSEFTGFGVRWTLEFLKSRYRVA